jgi:hypothetical protein
MLVIDYVLYNGEPIIEFRLKYLNKYVDMFIIVESLFTHSGNKTMIYTLISIKIFSNIMKTKYNFIRLNLFAHRWY